MIQKCQTWIQPSSCKIQFQSVSVHMQYIHTVWKFHDFSITQIIHEINFVDSIGAKSAILKHFEALNFDYYEFLHFLKAGIYQTNKNQSS